jgi:hypothetical protein
LLKLYCTMEEPKSTKSGRRPSISSGATPCRALPCLGRPPPPPAGGGRPGRIDIALSVDLKKKVAGATEWGGAVLLLPAAHQLLHSLTLWRPFSMDRRGGDGRMWPWPPRKPPQRHRSTGGTTAGQALTGTTAAAATK